ncbi:hypothetical protein HanIR_Chr16g0812481 [Helianthus annuus]|nr:hypothetical protein HanIR_Chr16g0812481 [Helianthus annuus]
MVGRYQLASTNPTQIATLNFYASGSIFLPRQLQASWFPFHYKHKRSEKRYHLPFINSMHLRASCLSLNLTKTTP